MANCRETLAVQRFRGKDHIAVRKQRKKIRPRGDCKHGNPAVPDR
jgi:hypothetical protein